MELADIQDLLEKISGCTFASIDTCTRPAKGIRKESHGDQVILFTNKNSSGYENMVKRHLEKAGLDPSTFRAGNLTWGEKVPDTPLIRHKGNGRFYLQVVFLKDGEHKYFVGNLDTEIPRPQWMRESFPLGQGLPHDKTVKCRTFLLENITAIRLMGEKRPVLSIVEN